MKIAIKPPKQMLWLGLLAFDRLIGLNKENSY